MRVTIDAKLCEGHGRCYALAPEIFAADDDGHGEVVVRTLDTPEQQALAETAARNCPESAIELTA